MELADLQWMNRPQCGGRLALAAELRGQLAASKPADAGALNVYFFQLRQPLDDVQRLPGDRRPIEVKVLKPPEEAQLPDRRIRNCTSSQIKSLQFQQFLVLTDEILDKFFTMSRVA